MSEKENTKDQTPNEPVDIEDVLAGAEEKQKKIRDALIHLDSEFGKRLSQVYEGVVVGFNNKRNPERIPQVCHSARELSAILPRYFPGLPVLERIDQKKNPQETGQRELLKEILGTHPERSALPEYLKETFVDEWMKVHTYFHKNSKHDDLKNKEAAEISDQEFEANIWLFEDLLYRILVEVPFFDPLKGIDDLLKIEHPTDEDVVKLSHLISQTEHRRYFFEKCDNPEWLEPLSKIGAFTKPQEPLKQGGYIRFIGWPESQYLVRIVDRKPDEVFEIVSKLDSENQSVLEDFIDAAIKSPTDVAVKYVPLIKKRNWIKNPYNLLLPDKIADLMEKLAVDGKTEEAIQIARIIFDVKIDESKEVPDEDGTSLYFHPEAKPYFDEWRYGQTISKKVKQISETKPVELFQVFASILRQALELEKRDNTTDDFYEYSHIWRPNLEHVRNPNREDAKNTLVDALIHLIQENKNNSEIIKGIVKILQQHHQALFKRIEMFLYRIVLEPPIEEIEKILTDKKVIVAYNLRREYLPLLERFFEFLSQDGQSSILQTISAGPNIKKTDDITQERFNAMFLRWQSLYYQRIKNHLASPYKEEFEKISTEYGDAVDDDGEMKVTGGWIGNESPISKEQLGELDPRKAIEYIRDYQEPEDSFANMSASGLGIIFASVITESPEKYVPIANKLLEYKVKPLYIYHFLHGLKETLKNHKVFDWAPVIDLCYAILFEVELEELTPAISKHELDWKSVRGAIADLLGAALGDKDTTISVELRNKIWKILTELSSDEEPTPEYEKRDNGGDLDPMTLSINTVRGEAMHAVINYGLWLARNNTEAGDSKLTPELEELLNFHLDLNNDPSLAIRSVYGWRLPNLSYLSFDWVKKNKDRIFPKGKEQEPFLLAALEGYLSNSVFYDLFDVLKDLYMDFIKLLGTVEKTGFRASDINERLPQHLMVTYVHGPKHDDLVDYFFANAPTKSKVYAVNFIGRVVFTELAQYKDQENVKQRTLKLWDARLKESETNLNVEELQEFGWWFKRSPFSAKDTIEHLIKTLQLTEGVIDGPYEIAEDLLRYVDEFPEETIIALSLIAHGVKENHEIAYKQQEYREIITKVKASGNTEAVTKANELINYLGSRGFIDFRDLLDH